MTISTIKLENKVVISDLQSMKHIMDNVLEGLYYITYEEQRYVTCAKRLCLTHENFIKEHLIYQKFSNFPMSFLDTHKVISNFTYFNSISTDEDTRIRNSFFSMVLLKMEIPYSVIDSNLVIIPCSHINTCKVSCYNKKVISILLDTLS